MTEKKWVIYRQALEIVDKARGNRKALTIVHADLLGVLRDTEKITVHADKDVREHV